MKVPRFRIASIMVVVAIVALDLVAIRALLGFRSLMGELLILGALPMANVLAVGLLIGQRRPGNRPFLLGFVPFGAMSLALYVAMATSFPREIVDILPDAGERLLGERLLGRIGLCSSSQPKPSPMCS